VCAALREGSQVSEDRRPDGGSGSRYRGRNREPLSLPQRCPRSVASWRPEALRATGEQRAAARQPRPRSRKASKSVGRMRIALLTRRWGNSPRVHSPYTVAVQTPSRSATSRTLSRRSASPGRTRSRRAGAGPCSTGAANALVLPATGWDGWTGSGAAPPVVPRVCERLITAGRVGAELPKLGVVGSNPIRRSLVKAGSS
jgi:hypothetical protein